MKNIKLKICGMKYPENIEKIAALHPDYLGFIFWEKSSRFMDLKTIPEIPKNIKKVGVFVNASIDEIRKKVNLFQLDIIQLHGNETIAFCEELKKLNIEIIKVFSIADKFNFEILKAYIPFVDYFLFDTNGKLPGGNGITFDWKLLENYSYEKPFFLSGGIGIIEIEAIRNFFKTETAKNCIALDVNSQFETKPAYKSEIELQKFKKLLYENKI